MALSPGRRGEGLADQFGFVQGEKKISDARDAGSRNGRAFEKCLRSRGFDLYIGKKGGRRGISPVEPGI